MIRPPRREEAAQVASLIARLKVLNEELDPNMKVVDNLEEEAARYVDESMDRDDVLLLVAVDESKGEVVGVIRLEIVNRRFYKPRIKAVITDFYVKPVHRRLKLGSLLIEKAMSEAAKRGAGIITAIYPVNNSIANSFYRKMGFKSFQIEVYKGVALEG